MPYAIHYRYTAMKNLHIVTAIFVVVEIFYAVAVSALLSSAIMHYQVVNVMDNGKYGF